MILNINLKNCFSFFSRVMGKYFSFRASKPFTCRTSGLWANGSGNIVAAGKISKRNLIVYSNFWEIADVTRISSQENAKIHFASFCYLIWRVTRAASPLKSSIPSPFDHSSSEAFKSHSEKNLITKFTSDLVMEKAARIENRFQSGKSQNTRTFTSCLWLQKKNV